MRVSDFKNIHLLKITIIPCFFLACHSLKATFYDRKAEGWHWYEDRCQHCSEAVLQKDNSQPLDDRRKENKNKAETPQDDPISQLEVFKREVERLKALAVLTPTFANVKAYMEIQKKLTDQATKFAKMWVEVVYQTPRLDYTLNHPTSQAARHVYLDKKREHLEKDIRALSKTYGLFFFYSSKCAYCKAFAPIVKSFSQKYGWDVLAISLDGTFLPEFPDSQTDNGSAKALRVPFVPVLLAVEPKSGKVIPLSYGMSTHDHIEDRISTLILKRNDL